MRMAILGLALAAGACAPSAGTTSTTDADPPTVIMGPGDALLVGARSATLDRLGPMLLEATHGDRRQRVMLRTADRSLREGRVMQVMNAVQAAGFDKIALIAEEVVP